eukprot:COSAG02_NODE_4_length_69935_cov_46.806590_33_plen_160_part_00
MLTGSLQDDEVHRHIVVGSSSLGHWHTGVGIHQGKQRNEDVHSAVAAAQIAHTESGIVHAPPPKAPEQRKSSLYEIVEKRLAEARARSATPVHPSRVNDSPVRKHSDLKLRAAAFCYVANDVVCDSRLSLSVDPVCFVLRYYRPCARCLTRESPSMQLL